MTYYELPILYSGNTLGNFDSNVRCLLKDGNFLYAGGQFTTYTSPSGKVTTCQGLAKINKLTGELDATFDTSTGFSSPYVINALQLDNTGLYVGGNFTAYKSTTRQNVCKVDASTAALDSTFDTVSGANGQVLALALDGSGNLFLGGSFITYKGTTRQRVCKVSANTAALDTTFSSASGANFSVFALALDGSGNLFLGGIFSTYKGTSRLYVCKVNASTAALNTTFDASTGPDNAVQALALDGSGNLFLGGYFSNYKGTARQKVCKVSASTAALDSTFDSASGANNSVFALLLDGSGQLFISGGFTTYKGTARERVCKVNATTAALDTTFDSASGAAVGGPESIILDNSNLYLGGVFTTYKGTTRRYIVRVNATTAADLS